MYREAREGEAGTTAGGSGWATRLSSFRKKRDSALCVRVQLRSSAGSPVSFSTLSPSWASSSPPPNHTRRFRLLGTSYSPAGLSLLVRTLSVLSAIDNPRNGGTQAVQLTTPCWIVTRAAVLVYSSSCPYAAPPGAKRTRGSPSDHHLTLFLELPPPHLASKQERRERERAREKERELLCSTVAREKGRRDGNARSFQRCSIHRSMGRVCHQHASHLAALLRPMESVWIRKVRPGRRLCRSCYGVLFSHRSRYAIPTTFLWRTFCTHSMELQEYTCSV